MPAKRFESLCRVLESQGHLPGVLAQIDYVEPAGVRVFWRDGSTIEERAEAQAILDAWPWGEAERHPLEVQGQIVAAGVSLQSSHPVADAARVALRHLWDHVNDLREHVGLPRVLEPQIMGELATYLGDGLSLPGLRPDLET